MDNQNRFEEVPQKENVFAKIFKTFGKYLKGLGFDFVNSFKYNNMKLPALLIAVPGVFLGFFLGYHSKVIGDVAFSISGTADTKFAGGACSYKIGFDYTGIVLFILMLLGILNIFGAVTMSGKKNLGSVLLCTLSTLAIVVCGSLYLFALFTYREGSITKLKVNGDSVYDETLKLYRTYITSTKKFKMNNDWIISIFSVILSMVCSVVGCVLGFIFYDRTYEKVDR